MCEKTVVQCFFLTALHRLPSHASVAKLNFFSMTVFKREIISYWLKNSKSRNAERIIAVFMAGVKYIKSNNSPSVSY